MLNISAAAMNALDDMLEQGYAELPGGQLGCCADEFTLFVEPLPGLDGVSAWIWSSEESRYLGSGVRVMGAIDKAMRKAHQWVELSWLAEKHSGGVPRFEALQMETITV